MELNEAERGVLLGCLMLPEVFSGHDYDLIRQQFVGSGLVLLFHKGVMEYTDDTLDAIRISEAGRKAIEEMTWS